LAVVSQFSDAQLMLVGGGPLRRFLENKVRSLGIKKEVKFTGEIEHRKLLDSGYLHCARVFCTPSSSETFGIAVIEAMAAGLPIVGVKARGLKDLVRGNGRLVRADDSRDLARGLLAILKSDRLRQKYAKRSMELAAGYSMEKVGRRMERVYLMLAKNKTLG